MLRAPHRNKKFSLSLTKYANRQFLAHTTKPIVLPGKKEVPLASIPKVELHLHFEGSMSPELIKKLAKKHDLNLNIKLSASGKSIKWNNFLDFLSQYDEAARVACSEDALTEMAYDYLTRSHQQGSIYNELTVSPDHLARFGLSYEKAIAAIEKGINAAHQKCGIHANIIIVLLRHGDNPDFTSEETLTESGKRAQAQAQRLVDTVIKNKEKFKHVVGIGLAGAEIQFPPELFTDMFQAAGKAGLGRTAHAGEWTNADDVMKAINLLGATRVGHGNHIVFDQEKLAEAKKKGVHFEQCPHSNACLNTKQNYPAEHKADAHHALKALYESGASFSLSSDDPPFFGTSLLKEYQVARDVLKLDTWGLLQITLNGIQASFASESLKQELTDKVMAFAKLHGCVQLQKQGYDVPQEEDKQEFKLPTP